MTSPITSAITSYLVAQGITGPYVYSTPPTPDLGDIAIACFLVAKEYKKSPVAMASDIATMLASYTDVVHHVISTGPYVNVTLQPAWLITQAMALQSSASHDTNTSPKTYLVEFACPNPMKAFHLGHLRNTISGEAIARLLEKQGHQVKRVNYQGDVGMHIAKSLYGIQHHQAEFDAMLHAPIKERIAFLGKVYAFGSQAYEQDEQAKEEIGRYNEYVYTKHPSIQSIYTTARQWSLEYFDTIYQTLDTRFDRFYFESEVVERGLSIVQQGQTQGIFVLSEGAIIYEGSKHGLHDRVFINSKGFPTYEGKETGLATLHQEEFHPDTIIHVVGKEQTDYFTVVFRAIEDMIPALRGKELHVKGGYVQLKGDVKMSSRLGNVITGDQLLQEIRTHVHAIMVDSTVNDKQHIAEAITMAAVKYGLLKVGVSEDVAFDMNESISVSGDSGPYIIYIVARICSILKKQQEQGIEESVSIPSTITQSEKQLLIHLLSFEDIAKEAASIYDPSLIAKFVFDGAKKFNSFYHECPILTAEQETKAFRLWLISYTKSVIEQGLYLLGIPTVEEM